MSFNAWAAKLESKCTRSLSESKKGFVDRKKTKLDKLYA